MAKNFKITERKNKKTKKIVLKLSGTFDGTSAFELLEKILNAHEKGFKDICIDTEKLTEIVSFGKEIIRKRCPKKIKKSLTFNGKKLS